MPRTCSFFGREGEPLAPLFWRPYDPSRKAIRTGSEKTERARIRVGSCYERCVAFSGALTIGTPHKISLLETYTPLSVSSPACRSTPQERFEHVRKANVPCVVYCEYHE